MQEEPLNKMFGVKKLDGLPGPAAVLFYIFKNLKASKSLFVVYQEHCSLIIQ